MQIIIIIIIIIMAKFDNVCVCLRVCAESNNIIVYYDINVSSNAVVTQE